MNREALRVVLMLLIAGLLQVVVAWRLELKGIVPDLWLIAVAAVALRYGPAQGAGAGFGLGVLLALAQPLHLAALPACGLVVGALAGLPSRVAAESKPTVQVIMTFGVVGLFYLLHYLFVPRLGLASTLHLACWSGLYTALLAPFFWPLYYALQGPRQQTTLF